MSVPSAPETAQAPESAKATAGPSKTSCDGFTSGNPSSLKVSQPGFRTPGVLRSQEVDPASTEAQLKRLEADIARLSAKEKRSPSEEGQLKESSHEWSTLWLASVIQKRPEIGRAANELRKKLLATDAQAESMRGLMREVAVLERYALAADQRDRVIRTLSDHYPDNSKARFHLDYSEGGEAAKGYVTEDEVALEDLRKLPIVTTYERLKAEKGEGSDLEAAAAAQVALEDIRVLGTLTAGDRTDFTYRFFSSPLRDLSAIEKRTEELEQRFATHVALPGGGQAERPLFRFFRALEKREAGTEGSGDPVDGASTEAELRTCFKDFGSLSLLRESFPRLESVGLANVTPEILAQTRDDDLVKRAEAYRKFLTTEADRVQKVDEGKVSLGLGINGDSAFVSERASELRREAGEVEAFIKKLKSVETSEVRTAFSALKELTEETIALEEKHIKKLLGRTIDQLEALPTSDPRDAAELETVKKNLADIEGQGFLAEGRVLNYTLVKNQIAGLASVRIASARVAQYETYRDEEYKANTPQRLIMKVASVFTDVDDPNVSTIPEEKLTATIAKYKSLREGLRSRDPEAYSKATQDFLRLERSSLRKKLDENFESAEIANFAIGVSIVVASALTAGLAAEAAAPFLAGRMILGGAEAEAAWAATYVQNGMRLGRMPLLMRTAGGSLAGVDGGALAYQGVFATTFVGSSRLFEVPFSRKTLGETGREVLEKPFSSAGHFAGEVVLTAAMFAYIQKAMATFQSRHFEKGLTWVARRRGIPVETLRQSFWTQGSEALSGTVYEAAKFQQWQFYVMAGQLAAKGDPDFAEKAARAAFSTPSILHGFKFLVGIKLFNKLAMPAFRPILEAIGTQAKGFAVGREIHAPTKIMSRLTMKELDTLTKEESDLKARFDKLMMEGEGDPQKLEADIRDYLIQRRDFLRAIPVEELDATTRKAVEDARTETQGYIEAYEEFGSLTQHLDSVHANRSFGIVWGAENTHTYTGDGPALEKALQHPGVKTASLTDPITGRPIVVCEATLPMGIKQRFTFAPAEAGRADFKDLPERSGTVP